MRTRKRRNRMKRINTRVDFTPMVDMMMLLLTFFMFCTTLSRPQAMDIAMPVPIDDPDQITDPTAPESQSITFILADKDNLFYYEGMPNYEDYTSLKKINYAEIRSILVHKNKEIVIQVNEWTKKKNAKQITEVEYKEAVSQIKKQKEGTIAVIKPTEDAVFQNLVDVLDEMAICSIGRYAVVDMVEGDEFLLKNYETKGLYAQENSLK